MERRPLTLLRYRYAPSDVFINSSQIQLVGLFVRRVSLSSPFHPSSILSLYPFPLRCLARFILLGGGRERTKTGNCREKEEISTVLPTSQHDTETRILEKRLIS